MSPARTTVVVLGGALLTAWLVAAAGDRSLGTTSPDAAADRGGAAQTPVPDLQVQAERLRVRLAAAPEPRAPGRNPFRFVAPYPESTRPERERPPAAPVADRPPPSPVVLPVVRLVGLAASDTADGVRRIAVLSFAGTVVLAREGDAVADRYRVATITPDVVELTDLYGGPPLRLGLR